MQSVRTIHTSARRYLGAAPLPHATGLGALGVGCVLLTLEAAVAGLWSVGWFGLALICQLDALARFREYRRVLGMLRRFGYRERIFRVLARSRCQRDAALLAAWEGGCRRHAREYYRSLGYRWFHLMPDVAVANPLRFLDPQFLRQAFLPGRKPGRASA